MQSGNFTQEHREKLTSANLSRSPELIAKIGAKGIGREASVETRKKIAEKNSLRRHSEETKERIGAHNKGHALSSEAVSISVSRRRERAAEKTHFTCKVHGPILLRDCFKRKNGISSFPRYECKTCKSALKVRKG